MSTAKKTDLLAPLEIWEVLLDNATIKFRKPLVLKPKVLPPEEPGDQTYLTVEYPELGIFAFGVDREDLWNCVQSCIRVIWKEYVCEEDCKLAPLAKSFKEAYLAIAEAVDG